MGEKASIPAIEVTPESMALAQGEKRDDGKRDRKTEGERQREREKFMMPHARWDMPEVCDVFSVSAIRHKSTHKSNNIEPK